jgi:cytochrome c oxidase cbb3-type subunit 2
MYDHPFQWGSKRTGPDLARVGGRYSNEWHVQHLTDPRSVVPESVMPMYAFLKDKDLSKSDTEGSMSGELTALYRVGVPYSKDQIAHADEDMKAQAGMGDATELAKRWPKAKPQDFDGDPNRLTEMDALIAYLQVLGTMVDVNTAAAQEDLARETGR